MQAGMPVPRNHAHVGTDVGRRISPWEAGRGSGHPIGSLCCRAPDHIDRAVCCRLQPGLRYLHQPVLVLAAVQEQLSHPHRVMDHFCQDFVAGGPGLLRSERLVRILWNGVIPDPGLLFNNQS